MANRTTSNYERALTSDVEIIEHIESQALNGVSVIKIFFHPSADINRAVAEPTSNSASIPRILPPNIITYNALTVPILQLGLSSDSSPEQTLYDLGNSFVRTQLATVQGAAVPLPFGGKTHQRQIKASSHESTRIDANLRQGRGVSQLRRCRETARNI